MTTSSAASAFGWQRRKESDDIKPLVPSGRRRLKEGTILSPVEDDTGEIGVRLDAMIPLIWGLSGGLKSTAASSAAGPGARAQVSFQPY
jgi:hypothetical protein